MKVMSKPLLCRPLSEVPKIYVLHPGADHAHGDGMIKRSEILEFEH